MPNKRPRKLKYNKYQKGRIKNNLPIITKEKTLIKNKGENNKEYSIKYLLISLEPIRLTAEQIGAAELALKRKIKNVSFASQSTKNETDSSGELLKKKKNNKIINFITKVFPQIPVTKKPAEVRMGKGKGSINYWMSRIKIGTPIFELNFQFNHLGNVSQTNSSNFNNEIQGLSVFCDNIAKITFKIVSSKLPVKTKLIKQIN